MAVEKDQYYSVKEVGHYLGVSVVTIYDWIKKRGFPQGKLFGKNRRFYGADILAWTTLQ